VITVRVGIRCAKILANEFLPELSIASAPDVAQVAELLGHEPAIFTTAQRPNSH